MLACMHCACAYFAPIAERIVRIEDPQAYCSTPLRLRRHTFKALPTFLFYLWIVKRELESRAPSQVTKPIEAPAP